MTVWREWQGRNIHFLVSSAESGECTTPAPDMPHVLVTEVRVVNGHSTTTTCSHTVTVECQPRHGEHLTTSHHSITITIDMGVNVHLGDLYSVAHAFSSMKEKSIFLDAF